MCMAKGTFKTINELLDGALADVDDSEVQYKVRSAQQLLGVIQQQHDDLDKAVVDAVSDEELIENLRDLGYLD